MPELMVRLGARSYPVRIEWGSLDSDLTACVESHLPRGNGALLTDTHVGPLYAESVSKGIEGTGRKVHVLTVTAGEASKSFEVLTRVWGDMLRAGLDRGSFLVALGGGVVGDLGGFVAATYMRGIPFLMIPTSLLAQVDSSVGGKVAVNHPLCKNLVGVFAQPRAVLVDPSLLKTLPPGEFVSGMAEAVKVAVALDGGLFDAIESGAGAIRKLDPDTVTALIHRALERKAGVVALDEKEETGERTLLNFGHTVGHALEATGGFGAIRHGEAVAVGMSFAARVAQRNAGFPPASTARLEGLLRALDLPFRLPSWADPEALIGAMRPDKKNLRGALRLVLPLRIGSAEPARDVPEETIREVLEEMKPKG